MRKVYTHPCVPRNRWLDKNIGPKCEKWLDSKAFEVYTALVSHNGLVRQKGSCTGSGWTVLTEKFVKSDELPWRIRVDLCVCVLKSDPYNAISVEYKSKEWLIL